mmetsp:Transcript_105605/g.303546  ORF Transcript_105605/g.303546 Transcript_105605/m.303546 type:complete len:204 (+) Transcript_105605:508-1119(+)
MQQPPHAAAGLLAHVLAKIGMCQGGVDVSEWRACCCSPLQLRGQPTGTVFGRLREQRGQLLRPLCPHRLFGAAAELLSEPTTLLQHLALLGREQIQVRAQHPYHARAQSISHVLREVIVRGRCEDERRCCRALFEGLREPLATLLRVLGQHQCDLLRRHLLSRGGGNGTGLGSHPRALLLASDATFLPRNTDSVGGRRVWHPR